VKPLATVTVEADDNYPVASVRGEVDLSNTVEIEHQLTSAVPNSALGLVLDLTDTTYIDSSGIRFLFTLASSLRTRRQELRIVVPGAPGLRQVLGIANVDAAAPLDETLDEALALTRFRSTPPG